VSLTGKMVQEIIKAFDVPFRQQENNLVNAR